MTRYISIVVGEYPFYGDKHTACISVQFDPALVLKDDELLTIAATAAHEAVTRAATPINTKPAPMSAVAKAAMAVEKARREGTQ